MKVALQAFNLTKTKKEVDPKIQGLLAPFNGVDTDDNKKFNIPGTTLFFVYIDGDPKSEKKIIFLN